MAPHRRLPIVKARPLGVTYMKLRSEDRSLFLQRGVPLIRSGVCNLVCRSLRAWRLMFISYGWIARYRLHFQSIGNDLLQCQIEYILDVCFLIHKLHARSAGGTIFCPTWSILRVHHRIYPNHGWLWSTSWDEIFWLLVLLDWSCSRAHAKYRHCFVYSAWSQN